jgi:hypothetical protein
MMSERSQRVFNTVKEIFEVYMPDYQVYSQETSPGNEIDLGSRLAANLLEEFRADIQRRGRKARQEEGIEE